MKKVLLLAFVLVLIVALSGCAYGTAAPPQTDEADEKSVISTVEGFGKKLQEVSLLAPKDMVEKSMKESYGDFVSQELIEKWAEEPESAPGRLTSSPWPDRIEIRTIKKLTGNAYVVNGEVIEITSKEVTGGGIAEKQQITLTLKKADDRWLIDDVTLGDYKKID
ncbi:MAG TPA: hypothetical protein PLL98_11525 [Bacillota bacterium]|nr:hypothetical protein [Bacillota bacterium]